MAIETILTAFRDELVTVPGLDAAYYPPPAQLPQVRCAVLRPDSGVIELGALEVWTHRFVVFVLVSAKGQTPMEYAAVVPYLQSVVGKTRESATLGGLGTFTTDATYEVGVINYGGSDYVGATLTFGFEEKAEVTITP
jgi:hypothetical protein